MPRDETMIAALKRERATYVAAGDEDRVRQVDESLAHYGYRPETGRQAAPGPGPQEDQDEGPQGRDTAPRQTADQDAPVKKTAAKKTAPSKPPAPPAVPGPPAPSAG